MSLAVRRAYDGVVRGIEPVEPAGRRVAFLVVTSNLSRGDADTYAAVGLARRLARLGLGVRLVSRDEWYTADFLDHELLLAMTPAFDVRRLPAGPPVVAWVRHSADRWRSLPALEEYAGILAGSGLSCELIAERYAGPLAILPNGFDENLFTDRVARGVRINQGRRIVTAVDPAATNGELRAAMRRLDANTQLVWHGRAVPDDPRSSRFRAGAADFFRSPEWYRSSILTIDNVDQVDVGWGHHGSRLLEALACGSVVATNTPLGLDELGLRGLPIYRNAADVVDLLGRAREGEFVEMADELQDVVRSRHGHSKRAASVVQFADDHELWHRAPRPRSVINFFPDWSKGNPYQRMLYSRLPAGVRSVASADPVSCQVLRDDGGDVSGQVLHVHWQNAMVQPARNQADAKRRLRLSVANITDLVERGMKLVWTIHNRMPHDIDYYFDEIEMCRFLAREAHVIHVLSEETLNATQELFEIDPAKVVVVGHSSYVGVYPELLDREAARERLNLLPSEKVVLFFGAVRPYKGLEQLVEAFDRIHRDDPTTRLLLVGQPGRTMNQGFLDWLDRLPFVTTQFGFVDESEVHVYFRAADLQVAPYTAVLNSGSVLLGLGFGLPVVAPDLGALRSLADEPFMFSYPAKDAGQLEAAMRRALDRAGDPTSAARALAFAEQYTGSDMSETFARDVLGHVL